MSEAPALSKRPRGLLDRPNRSNHHRYGEVKTRLTIGASDDFASLFRAKLIPETVMPTEVMKDGRITIPRRVRDHLGIEPGTEVAFRRAADGNVVVERADGTQPPSRFAKLVGCAGPGPSTGELMTLLRGEDA